MSKKSKKWNLYEQYIKSVDMSKLNSYELSSSWFDWCFENPEKIKPLHSAIYFFAIEHCNRLGWKEKFGLPALMSMEAIGIKKWASYNKAFNDLVKWGFIIEIQRSKNQYSSTIISLSSKSAYDKKGKALDKALSKHGAKHCQSTRQSTGQGTGQGTVDIYKQENNRTIEHINNAYTKNSPEVVEIVNAYYTTLNLTKGEDEVVRVLNENIVSKEELLEKITTFSNIYKDSPKLKTELSNWIEGKRWREKEKDWKENRDDIDELYNKKNKKTEVKGDKLELKIIQEGRDCGTY